MRWLNLRTLAAELRKMSQGKLKLIGLLADMNFDE